MKQRQPDVHVPSEAAYAKARHLPRHSVDIRITGIASLIYGVDDVDECTSFFADFGLPLESVSEEGSVFRLADGSSLVLRHRDDPSLPPTDMEGIGVRAVVWGLEDQGAVDRLAADLERDCDVSCDDAGLIYFRTGFGLTMGLRVFEKRALVSAIAPSNSPGNMARINTPRRWRERAYPKAISHVVFATPDFERGATFMRERLGFRLSDEQVGFGMYLRAGGMHGHHSLLLLNADAPLPGMDGKLRFHHANFAVDDIDEIMTGANYMARHGWEPAHLGLGRHRVDSALFYYLPCPAGGEAEYGADADVVDDSWVPRQWPQPLFAYSHWVHDLPEFLMKPPSWRINYLTTIAEQGETSQGSER